MSKDKIINHIADFLAGNSAGATAKEIAAQFQRVTRAGTTRAGVTRDELDEALVELMIEGYVTATYRPGTAAPERYRLSPGAPSCAIMAQSCRNTSSKATFSLTVDYYW